MKKWPPSKTWISHGPEVICLQHAMPSSEVQGSSRPVQTTIGLRIGARGWKLVSAAGHGEPNPTWIPAGHEAVRRIAARLGERTGVRATAGGGLGDLADVPMTAHFLGGCPIGATPQDGVVDPYQRVHGYPGLHVSDGSAVSANLGVNPSLTITAQAERAFALWPNRGGADPRPPLGADYLSLAPVPPQRPAVPQGAVGALRLG